MASETITILLVSNASKEALKIAASMKRLDGSMSGVTRESAKQQVSFAGLIASYLGLNRSTQSNTNETRENTRAKMRNIAATGIAALRNHYMARSSHTAGLNIGMLSVRIHEWLVPALGLAYSAMLPVIAGLATIGATAITAAAGLVGMAGVGLAAWSQQLKGKNRLDMQANWAFRDEGNFGDVVLEGLVDALHNPSIRSRMDKAVMWTKDIFHNILPNALISFVKNVDMGAIGMIVDLFSKWLPSAMGDLAAWGSQLVNIFGAQALGMVDSAIRTLAGAITDFARWMSSGGSEDVVDFMNVLVEMLGLIGRLGMATLPVFNKFLSGIYPHPLKPIANTLIGLMNTLNESPMAMNAVLKLSQALLYMFVAKKVADGIFKLAFSMEKLFRMLNKISLTAIGKRLFTAGALKSFAAGVAGQIFAGVVLGLVGVAVLAKTGILNAISDLGQGFRDFLSQAHMVRDVLYSVFAPILMLGLSALRAISYIPGVDGLSSEQYRSGMKNVFGAPGRLLGRAGDDIREGYLSQHNASREPELKVAFDDELNLEAILEERIREGSGSRRQKFTQGY